MSIANKKIPSPRLGEPFLLTPGPLTTSYEVKESMLRDWGSWDGDFRAMTHELRERLLALIGDGSDEFDCVPMQGSGSFSVEAMLGTFIPRDGKALVLANGAYGQRSAQTLKYLQRQHIVLDKGDYLPPRGAEVAQLLAKDRSITHVVAIHCETSSGILNPIEEIAKATHAAGRKLLIDSMSAFGALPLDAKQIHYDALVSSANKCIEGVPGFGFVIARKSALKAAKENCHSLCLDLHAQWAHMNKTGQWRFTPPTHVVAAFLTALRAHALEGGVSARGARYLQNRDVIIGGMRCLGFETLLKDRWLSPIIVTFFCPSDPKFEFNVFYEFMKKKGFIIYPGKLTKLDSFRIGCIGQMDADIMQQVVRAAEHALKDMGVSNATPPAAALEERKRLIA
ncbi:MAG: 2-aminoethylphosphonate--pyruvate transaminase [Paracoccaceae bacterium]|nr:2-aminoethylphosphonate--pyruvate transaminase [Paracoccaceae bacterium]